LILSRVGLHIVDHDGIMSGGGDAFVGLLGNHVEIVLFIWEGNYSSRVRV